MDRFEAMRVFVAVAEERSFARAARRLSLSAPAVTRGVSGLEQRIGTRLLHRTTRAVRLTDAGARFLTDAKRILNELEEAEGLAVGADSEPRGQLAVTAPLLFGRMHVAPVVLEFLGRHPQSSARTLFVDHVVDMMEEGLDVAIRIGQLQDSSLRATRVGFVRRVVCASPEYLARHGTPETPAELATHELVGFVGINPHRNWSFTTEGKSERFQPTPRLVVNTADVAIQAALAGRGLTRLLSYQAEPELRQGRLKRVLSKFEPAPLPIHVVHGEGKQAPARVRGFVELAVERLRALGLR
jgi:DNA-binding transcriptional LysR family regulator